MFQITLFYASLSALLLIGLSVQVVRLRRQLRIGVGSGGNPQLECAIRAHGNFCEYVPIALLLLLALELAASLPGWALHLLGGMLVVGRLLHGFFGLNRGPGTSFGRFFGTLLTWLMIVAAAVTGLWLAFP